MGERSREELLMAFIQNVSYMAFVEGSHRDPGENAIAIQILSKERDDFGFSGSFVEFPVSPYEFHEVHRYLIDDTYSEDCIDHKDAVDIVSVLQKAYSNNWNVIVHCAAGVSRSGAVCEVGTIMGFDDPRTLRIPNVVIKKKLLEIIFGKVEK